jgi:ABC-type multidrug transport system ATPase subunit
LEKPIAHYSSGMKQRVKLCGALLSDVPVVFLDEPTANLDSQGKELYFKLTQQALTRKSLIVASNDPEEYQFISNRYLLQDSVITPL